MRPRPDHKPVGAHRYKPLAVVVPLSAWFVHALPQLPAWQWCIGGLALIAPLCWRLRPTACWLVCCWLCVTMFVMRAGHELAERMPASLEGRSLLVSGYIAGVVNRYEHSRRFVFQVRHCHADEPVVTAFCRRAPLLRLAWYGASPSAVRSGQAWRLNVRLKRPHGPVNPGGFDRELAALAAGIDAVGYVRNRPRRDERASWRRNQLLSAAAGSFGAWVAAARDVVQQRMHNALADASPAVRGTLIALVTGNQNAIPAGSWAMYNRTGTSHLMSISGLHVTMFAALAMLLCRCVLQVPGLVPARLYLRVSAHRIAWMLGLAAALVYSVFSGWGIPAQRTCWMLAVAGMMVLSGRHCGLLFVLIIACAVVTVIDPWAPLSAGFWLSFVAVGVILMHAQGRMSRVGGRLGAALRTQWAATIGLLPLTAVWFGSVSLVSPLANAVAIPVISIVVAPLAMLAAALALLWPAAGGVLLGFVAAVTDRLLALLEWMSAGAAAIWITGSPPLWVLLAAAAGTVILLRPIAPVPRLAGVGLLVPLVLLKPALPPPGHWQLLALDVGQGSALLVRTANHSLLFDTGPGHDLNHGAGNRVVAPVLRSAQLRRINLLILSHADADHTGGALALIRQFQPERLLSSIRRPQHPIPKLANHAACRRGQRWHWDGVDFEMLSPDAAHRPRRNSKSNHRSCVLRIRSPAGSALLTGDIERAQEKLLVSVYGSAGLQSDLLIVPHHGSATSSSAAFLNAVAPRWALFQVGYRNRFRHPASRVLARYQNRGIALLRTDRHGAIDFQFSVHGPPRIRAYRRHRPPYWRLPVPAKPESE